MSGTKVFEDSYCGVFTKQDEFLKCLESIGRNSFWERKKSKNLRLVPITDDSRVAEELREKYAEEGLDEGIITDTILNTGLLLKVRNQYYPVRCCAIKSILDRAGISGAGLRRVEKNVYVRILNDCLKVAKGEALLRISEGKVSAVLGGDCHDYAVLNIKGVAQLFCGHAFHMVGAAEDILADEFPQKLPCLFLVAFCGQLVRVPGGAVFLHIIQDLVVRQGFLLCGGKKHII